MTDDVVPVCWTCPLKRAAVRDEALRWTMCRRDRLAIQGVCGGLAA